MLLRLIVSPLLLLRNMLRLIAFLWSSLWHGIFGWLRRDRKLYLELDMPKAISLGAPKGRVQRLMGDEGVDLLTLRDQLAKIAVDKQVDGLVLYVDSIGLGLAQLHDLMGWIDQVRHAGKHVIVHTDSAALKELLFMSVGQDRLMTPAGRLYAFGPRFEDFFLAPLLDRLGVEPQFVHIGQFKTATHRFHKHGPTQAQTLMMQGLHEGLSDAMYQRMADAFGVERSALQDTLSRSPLDGHRARAAGVLQGQSFKREVKTWLNAQLSQAQAHEQPFEAARAAQDEALAAEEPLLDMLPLADYLEAKPGPAWLPIFKRQRYIGVLDLSGAIVMGQGPGGGSGQGIDPDEAIPAIKRLRKDPRCVGVLLHINSPGGSALASDLIWREIVRLRQAKPVIAYCSDVAASGGYYLAVGADEIHCQPSTITGSIGVITGKFSASGALEKLGIPTSAIYDDPSSAFMSMMTPMDAQVMAQLQEDARTFYRRFLERVGQARRIERRMLHRYARGRVYLGDEAKARGLVDGLGGFEGALSRLYELVKLKPAQAPLRFIAHKRQGLRQLFSRSLLTARERALLARVQRGAQTIDRLSQEQVLALMPLELSFESSPRLNP